MGKSSDPDLLPSLKLGEKDSSLVVRYLLLDCSDLQRDYDRHRYRTRRSQQGCVVCARLHHVCNNGFHVSACLSRLAECSISNLGLQGLRRQLRPFWPSMVHYRWECADVYWLYHCWYRQEQYFAHRWLRLHRLRTCGFSGRRLGLASLTPHLSQGGGNAQLAAFALPELLPNKWRHWAIVLADIGVFFAVLVGPVAGRFSVQHHDAVRLNGNTPQQTYV